MAVSIMSACCRASVPSLYLLVCFLQVLIQGQVFQAPQTHDVFLRSKRANLFLLEEILQGNLERECYEELCSYEEAREYFEDNDKTIAFWTVYHDGDQCQPNPCLHGGNCTDKVGGFHCSCAAPRYGPVCERREGQQPPTASQTTRAEISECLTEGPTACHQLCTASYNTFTCSCMSGFKLQADRRSCLPNVKFPCGRLPDKFNTTASMCHLGNCPWQVSLLNNRKVELCAGVVLGQRSVLTAARCLFLDSESDLRPSNFYVVTGDKKTIVPVRALYVHDRFRADHHENDLALLELAGPLPFSPTLIHLCLPPKDFSENILMRSGRTGIAERRGAGRTQKLVYMTLDECRSLLTVSHPLSNKMFCMRRQNGPLGNQNRAQRNPNVALGNQSRAQRNPNVALGNQSRVQRNPNVALGNQSRVQRNPNVALGNQNRAQRNPNVALGNQNRAQRNPNVALGNQNRDKRNPNVALGNQNRDKRNPNVALGNQNRDQRRLNEHTVNQNQNQTQNGQNGTENYNSRSSKNHKPSEANSSSRSEVSGGRCGGVLPGTPVATVQQGTVFLTGLLISSSAGCDGGGLVFTKLSRYLSWIRPRLEAAEDNMTPQVSQDPEYR